MMQLMNISSVLSDLMKQNFSALSATLMLLNSSKVIDFMSLNFVLCTTNSVVYVREYRSNVTITDYVGIERYKHLRRLPGYVDQTRYTAICKHSRV